MEIIAGTPGDLPPGALTDMARYRYEVFVERLGWKLPTDGRMELDQFDRADTHYVIARNATGEIVGTARLLSTERPYLLACVFPQLLGGMPAPCTPRVWELSRFAAVDLHAGRRAPQGIDVSPTALALLGRAMQVVASRRGRRLVSVSPVGIERILRRAGVTSHRVAPPLWIDGQRLVACFMEVDTRWHPRGTLTCGARRAARATPECVASHASLGELTSKCQAATHARRPRSCCWPAA